VREWAGGVQSYDGLGYERGDLSDIWWLYDMFYISGFVDLVMMAFGCLL
jgi:hypothetical protein